MEHEAAYANIGRYFAEFSDMESLLNENILKALDLHEHPSGDVLVGAMDLSKKLDILKLIAEHAETTDGAPIGRAWVEGAIAICRDIFKANNTRRLLAHAKLIPSKDGNVTVAERSHSGGRARRTTEEWTTATFNDKIALVGRISDALRESLRELKALHFRGDICFPMVTFDGAATVG